MIPVKELYVVHIHVSTHSQPLLSDGIWMMPLSQGNSLNVSSSSAGCFLPLQFSQQLTKNPSPNVDINQMRCDSSDFSVCVCAAVLLIGCAVLVK